MYNKMLILMMCTVCAVFCENRKTNTKPSVIAMAAKAQAQTSYKEPRASGRDARRKRNMQRRPYRTKQVEKKPYEKSPYRPLKKTNAIKTRSEALAEIR